MEPTLQSEFARYRLVDELTALFAITGDALKTYENHNILERWLLMSANDARAGEDPFFAERKLDAAYEHTAKMIAEFSEKQIPKHEAIYKQFVERVTAWLRRDKIADKKPRIYNRDAFLRIFDDKLSYYYVFPRSLWEFYTSKATIEELAIICLRYACTLQRAQHWAMSKEMYSVIFGHYGAAIEGFASPLNTQIMKYKPDGQFCSLFYDTDKPMGSIGSFFAQDYLGKTIMAGPPYIQKLFDDVLDVVLQHMERAEKENVPMRFFVSMSGWADTKLAVTLDKYKYTKKKYITRRNEIYFLDTKDDSLVPLLFDNFVYVVSRGFPDENYDKLDEAFVIVKEETNRILELDAKIKRLKFDASILDLSQIVARRNYTTIKHCVDRLCREKKIPNDIIAIFNVIPSNRGAIMKGTIARVLYSIPGLKFPWRIVRGKCKEFIDDMTRQKYLN